MGRRPLGGGEQLALLIKLGDQSRFAVPHPMLTQAAKALAQVMDLAKGTDAFDNDTGGEVEETNDEAAQLADAFGFKR